MERLSLEQLKTQKVELVKENLISIKGGRLADCHFWSAVNSAFRDVWYGTAGTGTY